MRVATTLAPIALLATQVAGQLSVIRGVLTDIRSDVVAYGEAFSSNDAATIEAAGAELLATTTTGVDTVEAASSVGLIDAVGLRGDIQQLEAAAQVTYDNAISLYDSVAALGIVEDVHADFVAQQAIVGVLGAAVVAKVPAAVRPLAQSYVDNIDAIIAEAIEVYA